MQVWWVLALVLAGVQLSEVGRPAGISSCAAPDYGVRLVLRGGEDSGDSLPRSNKVGGRRTKKPLSDVEDSEMEDTRRKRKPTYAVPQDLKPFKLLLDLQGPDIEIPEDLLERNMTDDEAEDILKVLNLVPLEDGSIDPDELQHQLQARSRLLIEYYRQRMVETADRGLARMDTVWPQLFHTFDFIHNLQDGYFTAHRLRRQNTSSQAMQVERVLIPVDRSPLAHTREVDRSLWTAAFKGDAESVAAALARGANLSAIDWRFGRWSVLHHAATGGNGHAIRVLVEHGADLSATTDDGFTPLHTAAAEGNVEAVTHLVQLGAAIDARTEDEETPLHRAAANGQVDVADKLVDLGADIFARNVHLKTPSALAAAHASRPPDGADRKAWKEKLSTLARLLAPGGVTADDGPISDPFFADPERMVFIANIAHSALQSDVEARLREAVGQEGLEQLLLAPARPEVDVGTDGKRLPHRGYGWAKLRSEEAVRRSLRLLNRRDLKGRPLVVKRHSAKQTTENKSSPSKPPGPGAGDSGREGHG